MRSTRTPACSVTPLAAYHDSGLMKMSSGSVRAGEHAREQDAVVVAVRLVAEHRDVEAIAAAAASTSSTRRAPAMPLPMTTRRAFALIARGPRRRGVAARTAQTLNSGMRLIGSSAGVRQPVDRLLAAPVERHEHRVLADRRASTFSRERRRPAARRQRARASPSATPSSCAVAGCISASGSGAIACSSATRRVCVPDW